MVDKMIERFSFVKTRSAVDAACGWNGKTPRRFRLLAFLFCSLPTVQEGGGWMLISHAEMRGGKGLSGEDGLIAGVGWGKGGALSACGIGQSHFHR